MALFVDGPACTIDDLTDQDAGLLEVSLSTGINVATKIRLAVEEIRTDLQLWLQRSQFSQDTRVGQIVVTPSLKRWETMQSLALVYRDAYFSQLVDRYQAKWNEYAKLAGESRENLVARGFGLVNDPIPQAAPPLLSTVTGPQTGGTFYASVAWVNSAGQEGAASLASSISVADGLLMTVAAPVTPNNAVGFRVYAGSLVDMLLLQNDVVLPVGTVFVYVPGQITQGRLAGGGQEPDIEQPMARMLR